MRNGKTEYLHMKRFWKFVLAIGGSLLVSCTANANIAPTRQQQTLRRHVDAILKGQLPLNQVTIAYRVHGNRKGPEILRQMVVYGDGSVIATEENQRSMVKLPPKQHKHLLWLFQHYKFHVLERSLGKPTVKKPSVTISIDVGNVAKFVTSYAKEKPKRFRAIEKELARIHNKAIQSDTANTQTPRPFLSSKLAVTLTASKPIYEARDQIKFTVTITNTGPEPMTLRFGSAKKFDVVVEHQDEPIWRWSDGMRFAQAETSLTLEPSKNKMFVAKWNHSETIGTGDYSAFAEILTSNGKWRTESTEFQIK